jgi:DNA-binding NarL/FixJ family response regulator
MGVQKGNAVIIEDFSLIAEAWKEVLEGMGFNKILIFESEVGVFLGVEEIKPELMLIDINLKGRSNGIEITQKIREANKDVKIIILTMHLEPFFVKSAFEAGANGFVTKNSPIDELRLAINTVLKGEKYICGALKCDDKLC